MKTVHELQVGDVIIPYGPHIMKSKAKITKKYNTFVLIEYDSLPHIHVHWPYPKLALCFTWEGKGE